jgi:LppP/LprE lipoprotein
MPPPPDNRPWSRDPRSIEGNYNPCAALSVALITVESATKTSPQEALFFHNGQYVGPSTPRAYGSTVLNHSQTTDDTVVLDHKTPGICNACAPGAAITNLGSQWQSVRYKWQSDNVQRLDPMPPSNY